VGYTQLGFAMAAMILWLLLDKDGKLRRWGKQPVASADEEAAGKGEEIAEVGKDSVVLVEAVEFGKDSIVHSVVRADAVKKVAMPAENGTVPAENGRL
jgi:hypothetical protein